MGLIFTRITYRFHEDKKKESNKLNILLFGAHYKMRYDQYYNVINKYYHFRFEPVVLVLLYK